MPIGPGYVPAWTWAGCRTTFYRLGPLDPSSRRIIADILEAGFEIFSVVAIE
jgi:hypothetical protein